MDVTPTEDNQTVAVWYIGGSGYGFGVEINYTEDSYDAVIYDGLEEEELKGNYRLIGPMFTSYPPQYVYINSGTMRITNPWGGKLQSTPTATGGVEIIETGDDYIVCKVTAGEGQINNICFKPEE